ncbi:MAG: hypothetical protein HC811_07035 [Flammeovirgaceae bacterium]|nr:hypothetical protein [Flammeovirgaceae bacterium]
MKRSKIVLLVSFLAITSIVNGQDYAFKVMAVKGVNEVKSGDTWTAIKAFAVLKSGDELRISDNSYLGLMHNSGKPVELVKPGPYKVAEIAASISGGASVLNKYTDFILSSNSAEAKKNRLSATGAVHRGLNDIKVYLPENQYSGIYNDDAVINWEAKSKGPYIVSFKNMFDEELKSVETPETTISIKLTDPSFANETAVLVEVKSKADLKSKSEQHLIKHLSPAERERVKGSLQEISNEVTAPTALNKFIMAGFYEENKLYIDAITMYEQAIKLAPDVPTYKEAYDEFLLRNKFKTPN